jgi:lysozyme family protein
MSTQQQSIQKFQRALACILTAEGGYVNDPQDAGGETKYGISKRAYPQENIRRLTKERAAQIYQRDYWNACQCDAMPWPLALFVFDAAVNQGIRAAAQCLQRAAGVPDDGKIGSQTLAALNDGDALAARFMAERALCYGKIPNSERFGKGWFNRLFYLALGVAA